ncbi:histone H3 K4-specific methyltransferase SET7/9 N-terminal domain-containing protein [Rhizoclosmatium globosum]|uniref:MORN repeat-containing protein 3 n=1 Tax=Rhizoclosmatium globosum TaxID=329046 RepID=A0A1Y2C1H3_9FUNG|nr:histone H3 K4-specific methyltransferase SET7/9 N-terminal domain-containing protein [Rhizoclosmatium globosum]|eukprot:ORY40155.1 histone H3 K4-specific methyltransferase SET7/9 N-terminal domain-containing protein [Rhizoclosmatium globosum]
MTDQPQRHPRTTIARHAYITKTPLWEQRDMLSRKNGPHATVYMVNGDRYLGEWFANKKQGNGTYFYNATGSLYEGEWHNDMRNGFGTFATPITEPPHNNSPTRSPHNNNAPTHLQTVPSSTIPATPRKRRRNPRAVYAGQWKDDNRDGRGTYFYEDGSWYEGLWKEDQKEGWGRMNYIDGSVYDGEWHKEMRHGQGVLLEPTGDRYEGMWLDDQKEGPGKYIYKSKRQMYEGEWSKGLPKCGTLVDLPPLPGQVPKKYPIPEIKLADPEAVLEHQREEIRDARMVRMMAAEQ